MAANKTKPKQKAYVYAFDLKNREEADKYYAILDFLSKNRIKAQISGRNGLRFLNLNFAQAKKVGEFMLTQANDASMLVTA